MAKAARPRKQVKTNSKYNDEIAARAIELASQGAYRSNIAKLCGISRDTLYAWLANESQPYMDFAEAFLKAEAEAEHSIANQIRESPDPIDKKWYLSRRYPEHWGERKSVALGGSVEVGAKIDASAFADDKARELILGLTEYLFTQDTDRDAGPNPAGERGNE